MDSACLNACTECHNCISANSAPASAHLPCCCFLPSCPFFQSSIHCPVASFHQIVGVCRSGRATRAWTSSCATAVAPALVLLLSATGAPRLQTRDNHDMWVLKDIAVSVTVHCTRSVQSII